MSDRIYHTAADARCLELQQQIADEAATLVVYSFCAPIHENDLTWWSPLHDIDHARLALDIEYLALRGLIEYDGKLVRFVEGP